MDAADTNDGSKIVDVFQKYSFWKTSTRLFTADFLVSLWHMKLNLKSAKRILSSPVEKYSVNEYIETLNAPAFY